MEYNFNEYVAVQSEIEVLAENKEAMALIKTFDGTAKNSRGAFIAKAVSDLKMNTTTAGAYWQRNKKYAIGQDATTLGGHWQKVNQANKDAAAVVTPPAHKPARSAKTSNVDVASAVRSDVADWGRIGQKALPQNGVTMGPLVVETSSTTTKATGTFYGVKNGTTGNYTGWVIFPTEGYASKIIDNVRPVAPSMPVNKTLHDGLRESITRIGKAVGMTSSSMMGVIKAAHDEYMRNQEDGYNPAPGKSAPVGKDNLSRAAVATWNKWKAEGRKVVKVDGSKSQSQDGYMSRDGGGPQGRPYRFGIYDTTRYVMVGVVLFPAERYAYFTDGDGKRSLPELVTAEVAKDLVTKVKNLGEALDIPSAPMLYLISETARLTAKASEDAKGAAGDIKKFSTQADAVEKAIYDLDAIAQRIGPHLMDEHFASNVRYYAAELRKNLAGWKANTQKTK